MNRVSEKRKAYRDRTGIFFQYPDGQFHECFLIGNFQFLFPTFILVISLYGKVCPRKLLSGSVADNSNCFHTGKVKIFPKIKLGAVIPRKFQRIHIGTKAFCRKQLPNVCTQRIIGTIVSFLPSTSLNCRAGSRLCFRTEIGCPTCSFMRRAAGINILYESDCFVCTAVLGIIVIGDSIDPVQAVIKSNDASNIRRILTGCLHLSGKGIVFESINTVIPALCYIKVCTQDASDFVRTGNGSF